MNLTIRLQQFQDAITYLNTPTGTVKGKTSNFYFETSNRNYVLEVEKPTNDLHRLKSIINDFAGSEIYTITTLEQTGKASGNQYFSPWGGCYIVYKARGYKNNGQHYFNYY